MANRWYRSVYLRTSHWRLFRWNVLLHRPACEDCGATGGLDVHHLTYERLGCELPTDVRVLCRTCHKEAHEGRNRGDAGRSPRADQAPGTSAL